MKLLILGIDGGTRRILEAFDMPFTKSLIDSATEIKTTDEDLFSRGWAEMVTGQHASVTRGFYMGPLMDGTHSFSIKYKTKEAEKLGFPPIWRLAESKGDNVGIMNIPTTSPAQSVKGFMIGSGGGGMNKVAGIPDSLVFPAEAKQVLNDLNYIVDIRLTSSGIDDIETLFERLTLKEKLRAEAFVKLSKKYQIGFGFLVDRATTIVQYLCMSEIETRISKITTGEHFNEDTGRLNKVHDLLVKFYTSMDNNIKHVFEELKPEDWVLTADHSTVPYKYKGNMTPFLEKNGYLCRRSKASPLKVFKKAMVKWLPSNFVGKVRQSVPKQMVKMSHDTDWSKSKAFGHNYINGIYINDCRFGGPVSDQQTDSLVDEICAKFNSEEFATEYSVTAKPYRRKFADANYADHLADIILDKPDELHFVGYGEVIRSNPNYGPIPPLSEVKEDMFTGQKGRNPLFMVSPKLASLVKQDDTRDLTLVYKLAERLYESV